MKPNFACQNSSICHAIQKMQFFRNALQILFHGDAPSCLQNIQLNISVTGKFSFILKSGIESANVDLTRLSADFGSAVLSMIRMGTTSKTANQNGYVEQRPQRSISMSLSKSLEQRVFIGSKTSKHRFYVFLTLCAQIWS